MKHNQLRETLEIKLAQGVISVYVSAESCIGLEDFGAVNIRLDVGHYMSPPTNIVIGDEKVTCTLSFGGVVRSVEIPYDAILLVSTPEELERQRATTKPKSKSKPKSKPKSKHLARVLYLSDYRARKAQ